MPDKKIPVRMLSRVRGSAEARAAAYVDGWGHGWQDAKSVPAYPSLLKTQDAFVMTYGALAQRCYEQGHQCPLVAHAWRDWMERGEIEKRRNES